MSKGVEKKYDMVANCFSELPVKRYRLYQGHFWVDPEPFE